MGNVNLNQKVFNIDWLSIYCSCPGDFAAINEGHPLFEVRKLEYGTPQFTCAALIWDRRTKRNVAHVQWSPRARILSSGAVILKLANSSLYNPHLDIFINELLTMNIVFKSISRIDIALDFNRFDNGWGCHDFILKFLNGKIKRKGHGKFATYGIQTKDGMTYTGLQFGSKTSSANVYLYNKTLELDTVKNKPHIREAWRLGGLDTTRNVWRLEISYKSEALTFVDKNSGDMYDFSQLETLNDYKTLFWTFCKKLFCFTDPSTNNNVSRQEIIKLFNEDVDIDRKIWNFHNDSNISDRIFIKRLYQAEQYCRVDKHVKQQADEVLQSVINSCHLRRWFDMKKESWSIDRGLE